jgi:hypothetical protein
MAAPTCLEMHPELCLAVYAICIHLSSGDGATNPGWLIKETYFSNCIFQLKNGEVNSATEFYLL